MSEKKNSEYNAFESLARKLVTVPKSELDKRMNEYEARKARRKAKQAKQR